MMGKQGRMGSFSNNAKGKAGGSTGTKKKIVIKPFKVSAPPRVRHGAVRFVQKWSFQFLRLHSTLQL